MIYKSQEPLRILGDSSNDVEILVRRIKEDDYPIRDGKFQKLPRLEKPLEPDDGCFLYANSQFYFIFCDKRGETVCL